MRQPRFDERAAPRRFLLEVTPDQGPPRLVDSDLQHALRVLRLGVGDRLLGLDGSGHAWPLEVRSVAPRELELGLLGPPEMAPAPGRPGAALPWIEMHVPLPRGGKAEDLLDSLTQLGLARLVPLITERTAPHGREVGERRRERLRRAAREALKQCGRLWLPEVGACETVEELASAPARRYLLSPGAKLGLTEALADHPADEPLWLVAGPEGGLTAAEEERLEAGGAVAARVAPHILRIETAAVAALALAIQGRATSPG